MKIEVLYSPGCPNYRPAVERIERVLASESLRAEIQSVAVNNDDEARELMFPGSPTIRVDGEDVETRPDNHSRSEVPPVCQPERSSLGRNPSTSAFKSRGEGVKLA